MAQFELPYAFKVDKKEVIIQHSQDKHLRVKPGDLANPDPDGGKGKFARWVVHLEGDDKCRLQAKESGKFLRIKNGASAGDVDKIDVDGGQGPWTLFKVHKQGQAGHVKLESNKQAGLYIAVGKNNVVRIGTGGPFTLLRFFREGKAGGGGGGQFDKPYHFAKKNEIVIKHSHGQHLRVKPGDLDNLGPNGGQGGLAQWEAEPDGDKCRFKSIRTGKYLRIKPNANFKDEDKVDVGGIGGKWTVFKVHKEGPGKAKLESAEQPGKYLAVQGDKVIRVGSGGKWTELEFLRK